LKRLAGHGDAINPGLEWGRNRKVVHGRADDHDVRRKKIVQVGVPFDKVGVNAGFFVWQTRGNGHVGASQMQCGVGGQVTVGDLDVRVQRALARNDFSC